MCYLHTPQVSRTIFISPGNTSYALFSRPNITSYNSFHLQQPTNSLFITGWIPFYLHSKGAKSFIENHCILIIISQYRGISQYVTLSRLILEGLLQFCCLWFEERRKLRRAAKVMQKLEKEIPLSDKMILLLPKERAHYSHCIYTVCSS